jgi:hypothetical protein
MNAVPGAILAPPHAAASSPARPGTWLVHEDAAGSISGRAALTRSPVGAVDPAVELLCIPRDIPRDPSRRHPEAGHAAIID